MLRFALGVLLGVLTLARGAGAEDVPPAPSPAPTPVVPTPHPLQVGDVLMLPALAAPRKARRPRFAADDDEDPKDERRWYGLPIVACDAAAYGLLATAALSERSSPVTLPLAVAGFALGGPVVHLTRGQWGRAGLSVLTRAGLPLAGAVLGASGCTSGSNCLDGVVGLTVMGMLAASVVDVAALAYEPVEVAGLQPALSLGVDHAWLGASGRF